MAAIYCREDVGGSGLRRLDAVRIFEQLADGRPDHRGVPVDPQHVRVDGRHATAPTNSARSWVPRLASMEAIASYCLTEPGAGSDAGALRTKAVRDGDDYVLDGVKQFISGAGTSDVYVVMARTGGDGPARHLGVRRREGHAGTEFRRQRSRRWAGTPSPPPR